MRGTLRPLETIDAYRPPMMAEEVRDVTGIEQAPEWDDVTTQFAELVDGSMRTEFEFGLDPDGKELRGRDGQGMREVSSTYLAKAEAEAAQNGNLDWNLRRTRIENEETAEVVAMARGEGPNTMIVLSDFPAELWEADEDYGGYNVTRKQTMARVYVRRPGQEGISMITRTLDGSDREASEAIYEELGLEAPATGELLGQRRRLELTAEDQDHLDSRLTGIYDRKLAEKYGGEWYAGRRPADYRNTYDFVCDQKDIIATCIDLERSGELTEETLYNMAAAMQKRFEEQTADNVESIVPKMKTINTYTLNQELISAGMVARASGKTFSACGGTLGSGSGGSGRGGSGSSTVEEMEEAGFGKGFENSSEWHGGKIHRNSKCVSCKEVKSEVGACKICKSCVDNPKK